MVEIKKFTPENHFIKALIYGGSGTGKTVFAGSAPKPLFASAEGGLLSIAAKEPEYVEIKTLNDLVATLEYLKKGDHPYQTIIIDSITEINDIVRLAIEKKTGHTMELQDWGVLNSQIKSIFRQFRDLPMHVLFIAQEIIEKKKEDVLKITPSLNGKAATEIAYFCDIVGYITVDARGERKIKTSGDPKLSTKDRTNCIGNDTPLDMTVWVERARKGITIGNQEVVKVIDEVEKDPLEDVNTEEKKTPETKTPAKTNPPAKQTPVKEPLLTADQLKAVHASRNEMRDMAMLKKPEEKDTKNELIYTEEKRDETRKSTMLSMYKVNSSKELTQKQASEFIEKLNAKYKFFEKMETPKPAKIK